MKIYVKPTFEVKNFRANESLAAASIFEYTESASGANGNTATPVTLFNIQQSGWNAGSLSMESSI